MSEMMILCLALTTAAYPLQSSIASPMHTSPASSHSKRQSHLDFFDPYDNADRFSKHMHPDAPLNMQTSADVASTSSTRMSTRMSSKMSSNMPMKMTATKSSGSFEHLAHQLPSECPHPSHPTYDPTDLASLINDQMAYNYLLAFAKQCHHVDNATLFITMLSHSGYDRIVKEIKSLDNNAMLDIMHQLYMRCPSTIDRFYQRPSSLCAAYIALYYQRNDVACTSDFFDHRRGPFDTQWLWSATNMSTKCLKAFHDYAPSGSVKQSTFNKASYSWNDLLIYQFTRGVDPRYAFHCDATDLMRQLKASYTALGSSLLLNEKGRLELLPRFHELVYQTVKRLPTNRYDDTFSTWVSMLPQRCTFFSSKLIPLLEPYGVFTQVVRHAIGLKSDAVMVFYRSIPVSYTHLTLPTTPYV